MVASLRISSPSPISWRTKRAETNLRSSPISFRSPFPPRFRLISVAAAENIRPPAARAARIESPPPDLEGPALIDLENIVGEDHFDRIVADAQQLQQPLIILWMAGWCRKCIYLKPKLEKLAADYHPSVRFFCVDVNVVPQRLVSRAGVTRMPTIQLWRDGKKQAEVIGGHKAWLVVNEVREMIEN